MADNIKEKIIDATLELAYEKGLGRISISQIADRVGLKKSSIYSHFDSKDEIIEAMYRFYREAAVRKKADTKTDYGSLVEGKTLSEVLKAVVSSYMGIVNEPRLNMFYKVITSERSLNPIAAEIMVEETNTMILATKQLFYAMEAKKVAHFHDPDQAALLFAMGIHASIEFVEDALVAGRSDADKVIETFIDEFASIYC